MGKNEGPRSPGMPSPVHPPRPPGRTPPASTSASSNSSRSQADSDDPGSTRKSDRCKADAAAGEQTDLRTSRGELAVYARGMGLLPPTVDLSLASGLSGLFGSSG